MLVSDGATAAGATLNRDDCQRVLDALAEANRKLRDRGTDCAFCGESIGNTAAEHIAACAHHPLTQANRDLDVAQIALRECAAIFRDGIAIVATDRYRMALAMVAAALGEPNAEQFARTCVSQWDAAADVARNAERRRWRDALVAHGLHTLPANECFAKILETFEEEEHGALGRSDR